MLRERRLLKLSRMNVSSVEVPYESVFLTGSRLWASSSVTVPGPTSGQAFLEILFLEIKA